MHAALMVALVSAVALGQGLPKGMTAAEYRRLRELCFRLGENEPGRKWDAARALIREGPKAVPVVKTLLEGEWLEGRRMAAWILSEIRHESAVGPLAKALDDPDEEVRWKAAVGLRRIGKPAVLDLIAVLLGGDLPAQHCAAWALGEIADPLASAPLAAALESPDADLRWKAAISLSRIGKPALEPLGKALKSKNVETRRCAVWAIGRIGGKEALPFLEAALSDPDNHVRAKAVVALGKIPGDEATRLLLRMVNDPDKVVRKDAIVALGRRGKALKPTRRAELAGEPKIQVTRFGLCELTFKPKKPPKLANPFADAQFSATLVAPDDRNITVAGFYAGQNTWKARVALDQPGLWYYRLDLKTPQGTVTGHGAVKCLDAKARGFLRVARDFPTTLAFDDGSRFYPIGAGTLTLNSPADDGSPRNTLEAWKAFLDDCARSGMNRCRLFLLEAPWVKPEAVEHHPELAPWPVRDGRYDLGRFSLPFWDKLDAVLAHGQKLGIVFELTVFDETGLAAGDGQRWALHPFNSRNGGPLGGLSGTPAFYDLDNEANRKAQEAYVAYLLARTSAYTNVYYELNNEMNRRGNLGRTGLRWAEHWAAFFREHDHFDHLVALNVVRDPGAYFIIEGLDIANLHGNTPPEPQGIRMPIMLDETYPPDPKAERAIFWKALLLGTSANRPPWRPIAERPPAFEFCRYLADYAKTLRYWELRRDDAVVLSTPRNVAHLASVRKGEILVYMTGASEEGITRVGLGNGRYEAAWFDPRNGRVISTQTIEPQRGAAELPTPTFSEDILLRIRKK